MTKSSSTHGLPAIVLVYPRTGYDFGFGLAPPHSVLALSAYLESRAVPNRLVVLDQRVDADWSARLLRELHARPLFVGISSMTGVQLKHALAVARLVRTASPATPVVFGGVHVSLLPEQTLRSEWIDMGIVGEGEVPLLSLVQAMNDGDRVARSRIPGLAYKDGDRVVVNPRGGVPALSSLPVDRFKGVDVERYVFTKGSLLSDRELDLGETSRGCFRQCAYCYNTVFNQGTWRGLDAAATVEKIRHHVEAYRLKSVWLRDDNFFVDVERAAEVIEQVARTDLGLYLPGITIQEFKRLPRETLRTLGRMRGAQLRFGVESGSEAMLRLIKKGIRAEEVYEVNRECADHGVVPSYNFMVGFPTERRADVLATVNMMKRLKRENPAAQLNAVNLYTPYPGTALFERYRAEFPGAVPVDVEGWTTFHHLNVKKGELPRRERRMYENVVATSYVLSDTLGRSLAGLQRVLLAPIRLWFGLRWRLNAFTLAPEVVILRKLEKLFLSIE